LRLHLGQMEKVGFGWRWDVHCKFWKENNSRKIHLKRTKKETDWLGEKASNKAIGA